ncbi:MAG: hydantoinase/oxoprolinase family protein, partial [Nitrospira sp.]|nr:hydantoinase/oxoprolinase family protein [Nitrospira sp.]
MIIGIDIGGTFTDLVAWDRKSGKMIMAKVPTTPENQGVGLVKALEKSGISLRDVNRIVHGTTVATNALIQRSGTTCGLLTTRGFRDILELRRGDRPHLYGLKGDFEPLIPRELRIEVDERTTAEGEILKEVEKTQILQAGKLLQEAGVEAVVISFLHAYANPANEEKAQQVLKTFWPNEHILTSSEILPSLGEFERTSTAAIHAYLQPLIHRYLEGIQKELESTVDCGLQIVDFSFRSPQSAIRNSFQERLVLMNSYGGV